MEYREIVTSGGLIIGDNFDSLIRRGVIKVYDSSLTHMKWDELLKSNGLYVPNSNADENDLFSLIKYAFDKEYKVCKDIIFRKGYVFSADLKIQ